MMISFCSTSPPRRRNMPWGLRDPEPWSDSSFPQGASKLAARAGSPTYSRVAWGTCSEQERTPCARPERAAGLGFFQASGSGRDREEWTCVCPPGPQLDWEWRVGVRERERDWSELVSILTGVRPALFHLVTIMLRMPGRERDEEWQVIAVEKPWDSLSILTSKDNTTTTPAISPSRSRWLVDAVTFVPLFVSMPTPAGCWLCHMYHCIQQGDKV